MAKKLYLLIKSKSRKSWQIDRIKIGLSKSKLKQMARKNIKPGFQFKVLDENELVKFVTKSRPKSNTRRKIRVTKRRKKK